MDNKTIDKIGETDAIFEILPVGMWIFSAEGLLIDLNKKGLELMGAPDKESVKGLPIESSPNLPEIIKDAFRKREAVELSFTYNFSKVQSSNYYKTSRNQEAVRVNFTGIPMFNSSCEFERYIFTIEDVTELYEKEQMLSETQLNLSLALKIGDTTVWGYNIASRCFYDIEGSALESEMSSIEERASLIHPDDVDQFMMVFEKLRKGEILTTTASFRLRDPSTNEFLYLRIDMSVVFSEDGTIDRIIGVRRDITEEVLSKQKVEEALIGSLKDMTEINNLNETLNNLYNESQVILQSLPIGIAIYDKDARQEYINNILAKTFGVNDVQAHKERRISLLEDPMLTSDIITLIEKEEDFDTIVEYDLQKAGHIDFFTTEYDNKIYFDAKVRFVKDNKGDIFKYIVIISDITEKRRSELILEDSEQNLKLALEAGNVDAWTYDVKSETFYPLGDRCSFGLKPFNLDYDDTIIHPDDINKRNDIVSAIVQGKIDDGQAILRYKTNPLQDGYRYYDTRMVAKKENGTVVAIACAQRDVTDCYLHEIEREYSQKRIEFTIDSAELAFWEYDAISHAFTLHNNAILGLNSASSLSVDDYCKYLNVDDASETEFRTIVSYMNEGVDKSYSIDIRMNQKSTEFQEWTYYPVGDYLFENFHDNTYYTMGCSSFEKDEDGRVIKYVGYIKDNTKWVTLNETLVDINTQLKTVLDIGYIFPFICEIRNEKFYITATTPIGEVNIFPLPLNTELTLEQLLMAFSPEDSGNMGDIIMGIAMGDISEFQTEVRWNSESNDQIYDLNMSVVRDEDFKGSLKLVGYLQDVTERNQMISDLKEAKLEAEKVAKLKSAFLANMSHEIRTPLNAIVGFSELLIDEEDKGVKSEYLGIISTNNDLLLKLITDILDLSKIDAGLTDINVSGFDFAQFFHELYLSMLQRVTSPNVTLSIINPYNECLVELDKNRLAQICINYITNAIKYTPEGSIEMGYEHINGGIRLYVKDTGIGVADDKQHKLFQRFEKLDDFAQGTGLGLSITKALVESMKGKVGFESKKDSGSTFWAWVPFISKLKDDDIVGFPEIRSNQE